MLRPLGSGGMGSVFEAEHVHLGKRVALKTLHPTAAPDARAIESFLREARAAARLRHPHIVDVTDVGVEGDTPYLVMELLEGETLAARLRREGSLSVEEALAVLLPVCAAVAATHDAGVVHRDLKPENLFLADGLAGAFVPKVLDFGVSRRLDHALTTPGPAGLVGTPSYLSPEQVDGGPGDARSDQHALAVVLYECLAGERPYQAPTLLGLLTRIRDGRPESLSARLPGIDPRVEAAVARALETAPEARFADVRAFAEALLAAATGDVVARWAPVFTRATTPALPGERPTTSPERPREPAAAATVRYGTPVAAPEVRPRPSRARFALAGAAIAVLGLAAFAVGQRSERRSPPTVVAAPAPAPTAVSRTSALPPEPTQASEPLPEPPVATRVVAVRRPRVAPLASSRPTAEPAPRPAARPVINGAPIVD